MATALVVGLNLGGLRERLLGRTAAPRIESIAVLPLANLSRDPEQEYSADGMTEELITNLGKVSALRVISRTSVMQYKDTKKTVPTIARELNVDAVVEGAVLRSGDRVRINAQLIHGSTDRHLWAESYERGLRDILALQSDAAQAIAHEVQVKLTPQEQTRLASARPVNPEAYQSYLKGRYYLNQVTEEGMKKAIEYLDQAIRVELDPVTPFIHANLVYRYLWARLYDQAIEEARNVLKKEPNCWITRWGLGQAYEQKGKFDEAIAELEKAVELSGGDAYAKASLGHAYAVAGHKREALKIIEEFDRQSKTKHVPAYCRAQIYAGLGEKNQVFLWLQKAYEERSGARPRAPWGEASPFCGRTKGPCGLEMPRA